MKFLLNLIYFFNQILEKNFKKYQINKKIIIKINIL
jgi:hypothetical protein